MTNTNGIITYSEGAMELQHFRHPHPLLLSLDGSVLDHDRYDPCRLCWERLSSGTPCYGCKLDGCKYFYIHKSCAELPHQLKHPFHPKHDPLTLSPREMESKEDRYCDSCGRYESYLEFTYTCSGCKFKLCIKCASLSQTTKVDIHDHPLTLMRKSTQFICDHCEKEGKGMFYFCATATCSFMVHPECTLLPLVERPLIIEAEIHDDHPLTLARKLISFTCDACGKEGRGMFYFCDKCSFVVHLHCAFLPSVVKVIRHDHPLNLIYFLPAINPSSLHSVCQLCVNMVDTDYGVYYCSSCQDFVAHLHCATSKEEKDETFIRKSKDEESIESSTSMLEHGIDESTNMLPYVVKKFKLGVDGIEIASEIIHFSHEHDLKLTDKFGINEKCDACMQYIFTPYYACDQCKFFLHHKPCVELRRRMRHPLHEHSLILLPRATYASGSFECDACDHSCNGFTYNCEECQFDLDVQCSLLPYNNFTHDSHEHGLILSRSQESRKCNNCDSGEGFKFWCADNCGFALDFKCLTLPHRVWYEQHEHPFTLYYAPEDDSDEYYCDICESERDSRCWFYYCADCIYPAHPECILGKLPNIKFGKTFTSDNHQHPLTFVQMSTSDDDRDLCNVCVHPIRDSTFVYECAECNFIVHDWCLQ